MVPSEIYTDLSNSPGSKHEINLNINILLISKSWQFNMALKFKLIIKASHLDANNTISAVN